jgi:ACS family hexuronate transporter-like MFS transporter
MKGADPGNSVARSASCWQPWWPIAMMWACSLLSCMDRQILAVLSPMILSELQLSAERYGQIISAFSFGYMLGNPIWGTVLDHMGLRRGMTLAVTVWSVACGAHAVLSGFLGLVAARAVLGFGGGATFPGGLRTAMGSLPPNKQSRGIAVAYGGGSPGAIVTPLLVTPIALAYGWRAAFIVTGVAGFLWVWLWRTAVDFSVVASNRPTRRLMLPKIFERRFWSLVTSYSFGALPLGLILYLAPLHLSRALGFTQAELGRVLWIPPFGWEVGYFFWGWFVYRCAARNDRPSWLFFTLALLGLPLVGVPSFRNSTVVLGIMFWAMFVAAGFIVVSLRTSALAYHEEQVGVVASIGAGSWSAAVAMLLPTLGHMFDQKHYANAFLFVGIVPVLGAISWWGLTAPRAENEGQQKGRLDRSHRDAP